MTPSPEPNVTPTEAILDGAPPVWDLADLLKRRINPHYALLLALPWLAFLINPNWIFQGFGHMDPWYYFGMSLDFPRYQNLLQTYSGERLTWVLPARLFVALFSPVWGWVAFHLCLYWISAFSLYFLLRRFVGAQSALIAAALLAVHPLFLGANGWTYLDSGSIAYFSLALVALAWAHQSRHRPIYIVLGGVLWGAAAYNYLLWWLLTPSCGFFYWATSAPEEASGGGTNWRRWLSAAGWFAAGIGIMTLLMIGGHRALFGPVPRFFYADNLAAAQFNLTVSRTAVYWGSQSYEWIPTAGWIVFPVLTFVASLAGIARHVFRIRRLTRLQAGLILTYDYAFLALAYFTFRPNQILQFDYYASILIPTEFLVLGVLVFAAPARTSPRRLAIVIGVAVCISLAPLWRGGWHIFGLQRDRLWWNYALGFLVILAVMALNRRAGWAIAAVGLSVASFGLTPKYPSTAWNDEYNGLAAMQRVAEAIRAVDAATPPGQLPSFWFDNFDDYVDSNTPEYRAIMCGLQTHALSMQHYPKIDATRTYPPGTEIVLITRDRDVFPSAAAAMGAAGMPLRMLKQHRILGDGISESKPVSYWLTFTEVLPAGGASAPPPGK